MRRGPKSRAVNARAIPPQTGAASPDSVEAVMSNANAPCLARCVRAIGAQFWQTTAKIVRSLRSWQPGLFYARDLGAHEPACIM